MGGNVIPPKSKVLICKSQVNMEIKDKKHENVTKSDVTLMQNECTRILNTLPKREDGTVSVRIFSNGEPYGLLSTKETSTYILTVMFERADGKLKCTLLGMPLPELRRTYEFLADNEQLIKNEPLSGGVILGYLEELVGSHALSSEENSGTLYLVKAKEGHYELRFSDYAENVNTLFAFENNSDGEKYLETMLNSLTGGVVELHSRLPEK